MINNTPAKELKRFKECEISFKIRLDKRESDLLFLDVAINEGMADILKEVSIKEEKTPIMNTYIFQREDTLLRYKVFNGIMPSLNGARELLFNCELVDNKKATFAFRSITDLEYNIQLLRNCFVELCRIVKNINVTQKLIIGENTENAQH